MWAENANSEAEKNKKEMLEIFRTKQELNIEIQMKKANLEEVTRIKKIKRTSGMYLNKNCLKHLVLKNTNVITLFVMIQN